MSFLILLLYIFILIIRPQDWMEVFYQKPILDSITAVAVLSLVVERFGTRKAIFVSMPQNMQMLGFFFAIVMSHVVHTYLGGLIESTTKFLPNFVFFYLLLNGVNTEMKLRTVLWFIIGLIAILVPQGMYQLKHGYGWAGQEIFVDLHRELVRINWIGIFSDPNDLALTFVMASGILVALLFGKTVFITRILSMSLLATLFYGIYLTNSRGGILSLMVTAVFYFIKRTRKFVLGGIIGAVFAVAIFAFGPSRMALLSAQEHSAYNRVDLWYEGIVMMKSNPLFGVGHDRFMEELPQTAHNSFILAGAELGMVGLFFWVALIYTSFNGLSIVQANDEHLKTYAYGLQASLVGFCAAAFFLSRTYVILPYILFALSGSLMHIAQTRNPDLDFSFKKKDIKAVLKWCFGFLLLIYIAVKITL